MMNSQNKFVNRARMSTLFAKAHLESVETKDETHIHRKKAHGSRTHVFIPNLLIMSCWGNLHFKESSICDT